jgi:hypothetical protein
MLFGSKFKTRNCDGTENVCAKICDQYIRKLLISVFFYVAKALITSVIHIIVNQLRNRVCKIQTR